MPQLIPQRHTAVQQNHAKPAFPDGWIRPVQEHLVLLSQSLRLHAATLNTKYSWLTAGSIAYGEIQRFLSLIPNVWASAFRCGSHPNVWFTSLGGDFYKLGGWAPTALEPSLGGSADRGTAGEGRVGVEAESAEDEALEAEASWEGRWNSALDHWWLMDGWLKGWLVEGMVGKSMDG